MAGRVNEGSLTAARALAGMVVGALKEAVDAGWNYQPIPGNQGDLFEPSSVAERRGADVAARMLHALGLVAAPAATAAQATAPLVRERDDCALLASGSLTVPTGGALAHIELRADAPGADWAHRGRESALVSVYVDDAYVSDMVVLRERTEPYRINLGMVAAGTHRVEVRSARHRAGNMVPEARIGVVRGVLTERTRALADRYAPILQLRDLRRPGGRVEATHSDTPLLLTAQVVANRDGTRTITYFAMFSSEDGGTRPNLLMRNLARLVDYEPVIELTVDRAGSIVGTPHYQGPLHRTYAFDGAWVGSRPVLRVATANNNFSSRLRTGAPLWSQATTAMPALVRTMLTAGGRDNLDRGVMAATDHPLMRAHPWTFAVMGKEAVRERRRLRGSAAAGLVLRVVGLSNPAASDPRRMLLLAPQPDPLRGALEAGVRLWCWCCATGV